MKLLYFGAKWCHSCKELKPVVEREAPAKGYEVKFFDMDEDEGAFAADDMAVRGLPTIIILDKQGKEIKRATGNTAWEEVQQL